MMDGNDKVIAMTSSYTLPFDTRSHGVVLHVGHLIET